MHDERFLNRELSWLAFTERVRLGLNVANVTDNVHNQTWGGDLLGRRALMDLTFRW